MWSSEVRTYSMLTTAVRVSCFVMIQLLAHSNQLNDLQTAVLDLRLWINFVITQHMSNWVDAISLIFLDDCWAYLAPVTAGSRRWKPWRWAALFLALHSDLRTARRSSLNRSSSRELRCDDFDPSVIQNHRFRRVGHTVLSYCCTLKAQSPWDQWRLGVDSDWPSRGALMRSSALIYSALFLCAHVVGHITCTQDIHIINDNVPWQHLNVLTHCTITHNLGYHTRS